jgi:hypothetical protein
VSALAFVGPPLQLSVDGIVTSQAGRSLDAVTVSVVNRTASSLTPRFMVNTGPSPAGFWAPAGGRPVVLGPHGSARVILYPPAATTSPQPGARWLVQAYTGSWLSNSAATPFPPALGDTGGS